MTQEAALPPFDFQAAFGDGDPYATYAHYRRHDPVHFVPRPPDAEYPGADLYLFRHADVMTWLRDRRLGHWERPADAQQPPADTFAAVSGNFMLFRNPPSHTRLRGLANSAFTPRQVAQQRAHIEAVAATLAQDLRDGGNEAELVTQFAFPLPMLVIARMLGIPEADFRTFRSLANDLAAAIDFPVDGLEAFLARVDQSTADLSVYLRDLAAQRRADPQDDLISALLRSEGDDGKLSEAEFLATCILLLVAGHETTVNLIGNGTLALLRHREQWDALRADPTLAPNATEELLRFDAPVQLTTRLVMEDVEVGELSVPAGTVVHFLLGSANRDEAVFDAPGRLDIRRDVGRIMSFGMGIHFCLGAPLARMEGAIAFETLTREFPEMRLVSDTAMWRPGAVFHGLQELPVLLR